MQPQAKQSMRDFLRRIPRLVQARLSRKIITTVFWSIVVIEIIILIPSVQRRERELLDQLQAISSAKVSGLFLAEPELNRDRRQLLQLLDSLPTMDGTDVVGGVLYDLRGRAIAEFGEPATFSPQEVQRAISGQNIRKLDRSSYRYDSVCEISGLLPNETIVLRHDAMSVRTEYLWFIVRIAGLVLIISFFVTATTMIVLDQLLIKPILVLRQDLLTAGKIFEHNDPEATLPEFASAKLCRNDELGDVTLAFSTMVQQVATGIHKLRQAQLQLVHSEKMSSLGQLVAGIAHEINNPINFIYGNISHINDSTQDLMEAIAYYRDRFDPDGTKTADDPDAPDLKDVEFALDDLPNILDSMRSGSERVRDIVLSLRNFARLDEAELKRVDVHEGLENAVMLLAYRLNPSDCDSAIAIEQDYDDLPPLECYPGQLNQAILNILLNAIEAFDTGDCDPGETQPQITLRTRKLDAEQISITIQDNGKGIEPDIQTKIFDPFFTTKPVGQNKGLGLSIAERIVSVQHGGTITVQSEPEVGTEVTIVLPLQAAAPSSFRLT